MCVVLASKTGAWPAFGRKNKFWKDISEFLFVYMEAVRTGKLLLDVRIIK